MTDQSLSNRITRRQFLGSMSLTLAGGFLLPRRLLADCDITTTDPTGPYHVEDAPLRTVLASADEPGTRIFIEGIVKDGNCNPVAGAIVDVWHADDAGCYSVVQDCIDEDPFNCRGQMLTDAEGRYAFETIWPGYYVPRPRHFHYIVAPPSSDPLITQFYFEGDPAIPDDPWASHPDAADRIIPLTEVGGALYGTADIVVDRETGTSIDDEHGLPTATVLLPSYPNPFNPRTSLRYQLRIAAPVLLEIVALDGRTVRTLVDAKKEPGYHEAVWNGRDDRGRGVASGVYLARLQAGGFSSVRKLQLIR